MVSSSTSSKRARASSSSSHTSSCLVDGCGSDLSNCNDYHKRHKVCEVHAKSPRVMVAGQEQRFCQQCSRFHSLVEFDEVKRSCRKRLDGHNRRRRKPQLDSASAKSGILFPNQPGNGFSSYVTTTQMVANPMSMPNWAAAVKSGEGLVYHPGLPLYFLDRQHLIPAAIAHDGKRGKWSPVLQGSCNNDSHTLSKQKIGASGCGPVPNIIATSEGSDGKVPVGGLIRVAGSDCALSLLSMPTLASSNGLTEAANRTPIADPLVPAGPVIRKYSCSQASNSVSSTGFSCSELDDEQVGTILVSNGSSPDLQSPEMLQVVHDGPYESEANQAHPWYH